MARIPQSWRDEFMAATARAGMNTDKARLFLRYAATLQRLAEALCNGDWPADNGQRIVKQCDRCGNSWVPSSLVRVRRCRTCKGADLGHVTCEDCKGIRRICQDCRTEDRARAALPDGWTLQTAGDPRGCVLVIVSPEGKEIGVPS